MQRGSAASCRSTRKEIVRSGSQTPALTPCLRPLSCPKCLLNNHPAAFLSPHCSAGPGVSSSLLRHCPPNTNVWPPFIFRHSTAFLDTVPGTFSSVRAEYV